MTNEKKIEDLFMPKLENLFIKVYDIDYRQAERMAKDIMLLIQQAYKTGLMKIYEEEK